ncbi:MAG: flagellar biosynthetic protein FliO [Peptostreptococcaceae bacterium]
MNNMIEYILNILIAVPVVMILIVLSMKLAKTNMTFIGNSNYTKVLDRTPINKDSEIVILKIGGEGLILASSPSKLEVIKNLDTKEVENIEYTIEEYNSIKKENAKNFYKKFKKN